MSSKQLQSEGSELRIVLLGKTGSGISTSGNIILGREAFSTAISPVSVTNECKTERREFDGQTLAVVDTPGLFHTKKEKNEMIKAILEFAWETRPGPHVLLLVLNLSDPNENKILVEIFQKVFTGAAGHTIVLFTHRVEPKDDDKTIKELIGQCSVDYHVFDNSVKNDAQVTDLWQKIKKVVQQNGGAYYSNDMFKNADQTFKEEMKCYEKMKVKENLKTQVIKKITEGREMLENQSSELKYLFELLENVALKCMPSSSK